MCLKGGNGAWWEPCCTSQTQHLLLTCPWGEHRKSMGELAFVSQLLSWVIMRPEKLSRPSNCTSDLLDAAHSALPEKTHSEDYFFYNLPKDEEAPLPLLAQVLEYFSLICLQETTSQLLPLPRKYLHHSLPDPRFYKWLVLNWNQARGFQISP